MKVVYSHTSLKSFETCPKQFLHRYILKDAVFESSPALERGNFVHGAMEARLKHGTPLPEELKDYERFAGALDGKSPLVETPMGVRSDGTSCAFWDEGVYLRGKSDVIIYNRDCSSALILDWKTGKIREDPPELETHAVLVKARFPEVQKITGYYVWLLGSDTSKETNLPGVIGKKYNLDWSKTWKTLTTTAGKIDRAIQKLNTNNGETPGTNFTPATGNVNEQEKYFPPTPNGLCKKWCNVLTCQHNGKYQTLTQATKTLKK